MSTIYFVTPAPGHYGDRTTVLSSHRTLAAAMRAARAAYVVRVGNLRRGDEWFRSMEHYYPIAGTKAVTP